MRVRDRFFAHMKSYDRILVLRTLSKAPKDWEYELVEIPKALLKRAAKGQLEMTHKSTQMPKPGYCYVSDDFGSNTIESSLLPARIHGFTKEGGNTAKCASLKGVVFMDQTVRLFFKPFFSVVGSFIASKS